MARRGSWLARRARDGSGALGAGTGIVNEPSSW